MKLSLAVGAVVTGLLAFAGPGTAFAHQSPSGCTASGQTVSFDQVASELGIIHRNGDHLNLTGRVRNDTAPGVCDITDVTITIQTPNPDGTPGPTTTIATGVTLLAGTPIITLPTTAPYDVVFNDGVFQGPVTIGISGTSHYGDPDTTGFIGSAGTNVGISRPQAALQVAPVLSSGQVPFSANYTYQLSNVSPENTAPGQPEPELGNGADEESVLSDDTCTTLNFVGGNTDGEFPPHVDRGETWTFTCSRTFSQPGSFTNRVRIVGNSNRDGRPWPDTTDESTVTALGPDMTATKTHNGDFVAGETGRVYTLNARNSGNAATSGLVTLQDTLPAGLTATAISGDGWSCSLATLSCTRSDALAGGSSYPPVSVTVDVAADAPDQVTNVASVSGGGEGPATGNNSANDPTTIARPAGGGGGGGGDGGNADTDPPETSLKKPKLKGTKVTFKFSSDEAGSTFECKLDKKPFKACTSPKTYRTKKLDDGKHKFFVLATDASGNEEDEAAKAKFEIG